jgi:hypothetical protein
LKHTAITAPPAKNIVKKNGALAYIPQKRGITFMILYLRFAAVFVLASSFLLSEEAKAPASKSTIQVLPGNEITIQIEAKARVQDLLQSYAFLKKEKGAAKVFLILKSGERIAQILDITAMDNGTLLLVRFATAQGIQLRVFGVEDIDGVVCMQ